MMKIAEILLLIVCILVCLGISIVAIVTIEEAPSPFLYILASIIGIMFSGYFFHCAIERWRKME